MKQPFLFRSALTALHSAVTVAAYALSVSTQVLQPSYCGRSSGLAYAFASGGTPPYTYSWSNGGTEFQLVGVTAGTYTITVTDAVLDQATADAVITLQSSYGSMFGPGLPLSHCGSDPTQFAIYTGQDGVTDIYDPTGAYGPWPYSFSHPALLNFGQSTTCMSSVMPVYNMLFFDAPPGTYMQVDFMDADGCPGFVELIIDQPFVPPQLQIIGVGPSCQNTASGSMTVSVSDTEGKEFAIYVRRSDTQPACYATDVQGFTFGPPTGLTDGPRTFDGLAPGDHYLIWTTDPYGLYEGNSGYDYECRDSILFTVGEIMADCGSLSGRLYLDDDADCIMDGAENRVPYSIVTVEPGPYYLTTNASGQYSSALPFGTYSVSEQHPVFAQSCPADFTLSGPGTQTANTGCAGGQPLDVMVNAANGAARPGFELDYSVHVRNLTPSSTGTVTLTLEIDPVLGFISASPAPTSVVGNIITWTAPVFSMTNIFQENHFHVDVQVPPDVGLMGTTLEATANIATQNTDGDLSNNSHTTSVIVTGSLDPNEKVAATSSRSSDQEYIIDQDEWIDYTIRFQNTGTDTAFNVLITDTLPVELDPASLIMGAGSHPYTWSMGLTGTLSVIFNDILLPDSNVNEPASHGFVLLRIKPRAPLLAGTSISNVANIFFDFNPAVITEPSVLVAEFSTDLEARAAEHDLVLFPNPAQGSITIASRTGNIERLELMSADGRSIGLRQAGDRTVAVDISTLAPGSYLVHALLSGGGILHIPFVKY